VLFVNVREGFSVFASCDQVHFRAIKFVVQFFLAYHDVFDLCSKNVVSCLLRGQRPLDIHSFTHEGRSSWFLPPLLQDIRCLFAVCEWIFYFLPVPRRLWSVSRYSRISPVVISTLLVVSSKFLLAWSRSNMVSTKRAPNDSSLHILRRESGGSSSGQKDHYIFEILSINY
jgi:hypothetical protein